ncbi:MAG TPA: type II secretion system F family protein [Candidatus Paceibacterota bacterium]|nr:type II secretion system F family protein [Candidatus Paceibacterota bacterium]
MLFHYVAQDKQGRIKEGNVSQPNLQAALDFLASQNLKPISVRPIALEKAKKGIIIRKESLSLTDKVFLTKYLSLMLKVGTDLFSAIDILIEDFESGPARRFLLEIRSNLEKGQPFYLAFQNHPDYFSQVVINLIKAGESAGNLEKTLEQVSSDLEREKELSSKVKSALIYPMILVATSFFMIIFLATFAIPKLSEMFLSTGKEVPLYTRIVLGVGMFLNRYVFIVIPLIIGVPLILYFYFSKNKTGKMYFNNLLEKIPVVKNLVEKMALERFASVLGSLIKAGMPIIQAVEVTAQAVGNPKYEASLNRIAKEYLSKGISIGDSFKREKIFPAVVSNLLAIGEKAGHTEEILFTLSTFYESEIDVALKTLVSFIEPALLVIIGIIVGGIALSLIVPVYQLVGQF